MNCLGTDQQNTASSHTAGRSAHNTGYAEEVGETPSPQTRRPHKRLRIDSPATSKNLHAAPSSRDLMPPPPKSISRMRSVRNIFPTIRKKFSNGKPSPLPRHPHPVNSDVQMYENGYWEAVSASDQPSSDQDRPPARHDTQRNSPYMTGALPIENHEQTLYTRELQSRADGEPNDSRAEFTFRSPSPIKMIRHSNTLPTEPSYIRLLDDLGHDSGLNLGLQDPRGDTCQQIYASTPTAQRGGDGRRDDQPWRLSNDTPNQSPLRVPSSQTYRQPNIRKSRPVNVSSRNTPNRMPINPVTPAPARFQRPAQEVDQVVSPFFGNTHHSPIQYIRAPVAERKDSMIPSNGYLYRRQPQLTEQADWRRGRSLNGLSFFDSPLNDRNEPIERRHEARQSEYIAPPQQYQRRNFYSRGFNTRPENIRSPYANNGSYDSFDKSYRTCQQPVHSRSVIPFPSFDRTSQSRAAPLPSATNAFISNRVRSPIRNKSRLNGLERAGVRSSRMSHRSIPGNAFPTPGRTVFSSSGRRSIRR
jgi:hypothetical protein